MEDMARLALVEQTVRDTDSFSKILYELLRHINHIMENPHDYELRAIKSEVLKKAMHHEIFVDYLQSVGFRSVNKEYTYPKEAPLSNLRMAQAAIERKIYFCCGSVNQVDGKKSRLNLPQTKRPKFTPVRVLQTRNQLLLRIESMFNDMIKYEEEGLQALAREHIPMVTLQLMAVDRLRDHQRRIKTGEIKGPDMAFDIALLMELLGWFKHSFFTWVDSPPCDVCSGPTSHARNTTEIVGNDTCRVEHYKCKQCPGWSRFVRHNDLRTLLTTRRGRCGEWANCFTLICRATGYDTRYVYDTTDHVWCEVFDYDTNSWLHVDPCEGEINSPLVYSHGWGKKLNYVIALSRDDVQDVTWRYTMDHKEVLKRRTLCTEHELLSAMLSLREARQKSVSDARRQYLARRTLMEIVTLMVERKPSDYESHGRISGSATWRGVRGEAGEGKGGHVFTIDNVGEHTVRYYCANDRYTVSCRDSDKVTELASWSAGAYIANNIQHNVEKDWQMVYLARYDGSNEGVISWRIEAGKGLKLSNVTVTAVTAEFDSGQVAWSATFDDKEPTAISFTGPDTPVTLHQPCVTFTLTARLRGGSGDVAWQHAQVLRQHALATNHALEILVNVTNWELDGKQE